jgi:hypothetical protein
MGQGQVLEQPGQAQIQGRKALPAGLLCAKAQAIQVLPAPVERATYYP